MVMIEAKSLCHHASFFCICLESRCPVLTADFVSINITSFHLFRRPFSHL